MSSHPDAQISPGSDGPPQRWPGRREAPDGSPNVLVVLLDDVGFSQMGCFGSDIDTPNIDRLADEGIRYTNFHTAALCSPTRASLLTGRHPHAVGFGHIVERAAGYPGYTARLPDSAATVAEILRRAGYSTRAVGKWHLLPSYEAGPAGPFERWPLGRGFERFYGFLGGSTDQYVPELYRDNSPTRPPNTPDQGYHLTTDLVDEAIDQIRQLRGVGPRKPFFMYLATGACHAPHQAPREYIDRYRGCFDGGWDAARDRTIQRQRDLGLLPEEVQLPPSNPGVADWDSLPPQRQRLYARMMEVYAGFLTHTDAQIGRLLDFLRETNDLDNTLVVLLSDNGASAEGGPEGSLDEALYFNDLPQRADDAIPHEDDLGGPKYYNHYPWGWAQAGNTPFRWYKQFTHAGGITNGCVVRMPGRIDDPGGLRTQYHHVIDLVPTILNVTAVTAPTEVDGVRQQPLHGVSMAYSFDDPAAAGQRHNMHYEMWGNRGYWRDGWMAVSRLQPDAPGAWPPAPLSAGLDDANWELYDHHADPAERHDVAADHPQLLDELVDAWWSDARRHDVLPVDARARSDRWSPQPQPVGATPGRATYFGPCGPYERGVAPTITGRSFELRATTTVGASGAQGVLYALGSRHGGYSWYVKDGRQVFEVNLMSVERTVVSVPCDLTPGGHVLGLRVEADESLAGRVVFTVDGRTTGVRHVHRLLKVAPIGGGRTHVGFDPASSVSDRYRPPFRFTGVLHHVEVVVSGPNPVDEDLANCEVVAAMKTQ